MTGDTKAVLATPMQENDAAAMTVGEYLTRLLADVWRYDEGFNGKRPFGNSGWKSEVYVALVVSGAVKGSVDADGYLDECDDNAADALIFAAIKTMAVSA